MPDLNWRPHRPERCALPDCANPRQSIFYPKFMLKSIYAPVVKCKFADANMQQIEQALVVQWIERRRPKANAAGSTPAKGTNYYLAIDA